MFKSLKTIAVVLVVGAMVVAGAIAVGGWAQATPAASAAAVAPMTAPAADLHLDIAKYADLALTSFEKQLGIDDAQLNAAFTGAVGDTLKQAVTDGILTSEQAAQANAFVKDGVTGLIAKLKTFAPKFGLGQNRQNTGLKTNVLAPASLAAALGLNSADFENELRSGKSIADIAQEHHIDLTALQSTVLANAKRELDAAVSAGQLTQSQADQMEAALTMKLKAIVSQTTSPNSSARPLLKDAVTIDRAKYANLFITAFESRLGIDDARLDAAFKATVSATTAQAITDGILTSDQAAQVNDFAGMGVRQLAALTNKFPFGPFGGARNPLGNSLPSAAIASALKLSTTDLEVQLKAGKSIADIAAAQHLDLTQVKQALQAQLKAQLDDAVRNGKLTQMLADQIYAKLNAGLDTLITRPLFASK